MWRDLLFYFLTQPAAAIALLTPVVLLVHGYHPLADDGAVYVTGIKKLADPGLYQTDAVFALSPTHLSIFAHVLAGLLRWGHISLPVLLLVCHAGFDLSLSSRLVASGGTGSFPRRQARWGAVLLAACCFTLPVAGHRFPSWTPTSLRAPSPLRSCFSRWRRCSTSMGCLRTVARAGRAAASLDGCLCGHRHAHGRCLPGAGCGAPSALACRIGGCSAPSFSWPRVTRPQPCLQPARPSAGRIFSSPAGNGMSIRVYLCRCSCWASRRPRRAPWPARTLAIAATIIGGCALLTSLCFVHRSGSLLLARLQVLRAFHFVYIAGVLLAGGMLARLAQQRTRHRAALPGAFSSSCLPRQRLTYPASNHVEWPGRTPRNPWQQAFLWIRANTPRIRSSPWITTTLSAPARTPRAFAQPQREAPSPTGFKDGGIASNFPQAAIPWWQGSQATEHLNGATDEQRLARLRPLGVAWIVLPAEAKTGFPCPFTNAGCASAG